MGSFSLIFGSLAGLNLRKGCSVALCGEHTRSLILIWSTHKRNQASPRHMAKGSNWGKSFSFFMKGDMLVVIAGFPMTSLKFKSQNYRSDWDFTLIMFNDVFDRAAENIQIWWKHFSRYLVNEIYLWPKSWRGSLHIYLLLFSRVWTLSIEQFYLFIYLFIYCNKKDTN